MDARFGVAIYLKSCGRILNRSKNNLEPTTSKLKEMLPTLSS